MNMHVNSSLWTAASMKIDTTKTSRHQFYLQITSQICPFLSFSVVSLPNPGYITSTYLLETVIVFTFILQFILHGEARGVFSKQKSEQNINQITATLLKPPILHLDYIQTCYPVLWSPLPAGPYLPFKSHRILSSFAPKIFCHSDLPSDPVKLHCTLICISCPVCTKLIPSIFTGLSSPLSSLNLNVIF